jgi:uncharacterized protein (DUF1330 family)
VPDRELRIVSLWLRDGVEASAFEAFERKAAAVMASHGGRIERAIRTDGAGEGAPFEVHLISFPDAAAFESYRADPQTRALRAERELIIARTEVISGIEAGPYDTGDQAADAEKAPFYQ